MKLSDYLAREGMSYAEFARRVGIKHRRTIHRVARDGALPQEDLMQAIYLATNGEVTPNDFFELPALPDGGQTEKAAA